MSDLITRLEASTEGSRELDAHILAELNGPDWVVENQYSDNSGKWLAFCTTRFSDQAKTRRVAKAAIEYTTSIDAALTLVPKGWRTVDAGQIGDKWGWAISDNVSKMFDPIAATAPLAICIAALKART